VHHIVEDAIGCLPVSSFVAQKCAFSSILPAEERFLLDTSSQRVFL
jgi:hypothetical protein